MLSVKAGSVKCLIKLDIVTSSDKTPIGTPSPVGNNFNFTENTYFSPTSSVESGCSFLSLLDGRNRPNLDLSPMGRSSTQDGSGPGPKPTTSLIKRTSGLSWSKLQKSCRRQGNSDQNH